MAATTPAGKEPEIVLKVKLPHKQRCMFSGMMLLVGARTHEEALCLMTLAERCFLRQNLQTSRDARER